MRDKILKTIQEFSKDEDGNKQHINPVAFGFLSDAIVSAMCEADSNAVLADARALPRYAPYCSGHYGDGYMCEKEAGEWVEIEEVERILSEHFS